MKRLVILLAIFALLPTTMATNFELSVNDAKGDVNDADIDIVKAWTTKKDSNIVFHIQVAGKINNNYYYWITATNGSEEVGAIYSGGYAIYSGSTYTTSWGQPHTSIENGNTLAIEIPAGIFSSWKHFAFQAFAGKGYMMEGDFTQQVGDVGGNGGNGGENNDPTKEKPTDETIKVKITDVKYNFKKVGNSVEVYTVIKGTTNGVDHVSLSYVIYYKNGTHEYESWIKGPMNVNTNYGGYKINLFFNSTSGQWNTWEFRLNGTYPITDYEWLYGENEANKVSKISIYARAFKDKEETKWNQCHYDTKPSFSGDTASYGMSSNGGNKESKEKSKTPGFELLAIAMAIVVAMTIKRKMIRR